MVDEVKEAKQEKKERKQSEKRASEQAKYLNTAETPIYKKNEVLFNLAGARTAIARSGEVYVVEGYTDVIGLVQAGIEHD